MKLLRVHSFHVVVAILCCSVLYTGTLQASTGGHKYHDPTALEYLQRIVDHYLGLDATGPYDLPAHPCAASFRPIAALKSAATFMQERGCELPGLFAPGARYGACRPITARANKPAYTIVARVPDSTNALQTAVMFQHNLVGWIESLTFDRPLTLADGATYPAGTPVPIEPLMRALALRRTTLPPAPQTLTIKRAVQKTSYANRDTNLIAAPAFEAVRAFLATNPPLRGLTFTQFYFAVDCAAHSASNVPMLGRITKSSSALGNIKPPREK